MKVYSTSKKNDSQQNTQSISPPLLSSSVSEFLDNRQIFVENQRRLQFWSHNNARSIAQRQLKQSIDNSARVNKITPMQHAIDNRLNVARKPAMNASVVAQLKYDRMTNSWLGKKRPAKTKELKKANLDAKKLDHKDHTAHHKIDYAEIKNNILAALSHPASVPNPLDVLKNIALIASTPLSNHIVTELNLPYAQRTQAFEDEVNKFMTKALWPNWDIFIGALSNDRADDPTVTHASVDTHHTKSGHTTPKSELARDITYQGGIGGVDPNELSKRGAARETNEPSKFDPSEWHTGPQKGKKDQYQTNDPRNWDAPFAEIVFPKDKEKLVGDDYTLRLDGNAKSTAMEVKIQIEGTDGQWLPARQTTEGAWWFDWKNIQPGNYELMARATDANGKEFVSRHVVVSK